ncbi:MAG: T9SS type A sorting domain-containing protein [Sediminibacterium sp.]
MNPLKREVRGMHTYWLYLILLDPLGLAIQGGSKTLHSEQDSIIMDWSIGQPAVLDSFNKDASLIVNTGFLQNKNCDKCLYKSLDSFLVQVKIGPNPTEHNLYTHINQLGLIWQGWEMYNLEGKLLERRVINLSGLRLQYTINLSNYSKGMYFLKYYFLIDQQISIIKTIQIYKS